jgi:hypothetical protein
LTLGAYFNTVLGDDFVELHVVQSALSIRPANGPGAQGNREANRYATERCRFGPKLGSFAGILAVSSCLLLIPAGCAPGNGGGLSEAENYAPGVLYTVAIDPIAAPTPANLVENGDFSAWQPGAGAPDYFLPPDPARGFSTIAPAEGMTPESRAVKQTWSKSDSIEGYTNVFRHWVMNLRPNSTYRLSVTVNNPSAQEIFLRAFQFNAPSAAEAENSTEVPPALGGIVIGQTDGFEEFETEFTTGPEEVFCVLLAPKLRSPEGEFPSECTWDSWRITEVAGAPQPATP